MNTTVEFTEVMLLLVAVIAAVIQGFKKMIHEEANVHLQIVKPFLPLVAIAFGIACCFATKQTNPIVAGIVVGAGSVFGFDLMKGISPKNGAKIVLCLLLLNVAGCMPTARPIQMDPIIQAHVELAATTTAEFNRRCQAGDPNACSTGLALASETLDIIVDGLHGEVTQ